MAKQKQDDQSELTYSSYVRTWDVTQKTCRRRWMIGRSGKRWPGISVLAAQHDDDDEMYVKTVLFQTFQLSIRTQFSSICPIDRTLSGSTNRGHSGPVSDGNKCVLHIPQSTSITEASPSDRLVSYPGHAFGEALPFCRDAVRVFCSPSRALAVWIQSFRSPRLVA